MSVKPPIYTYLEARPHEHLDCSMLIVRDTSTAQKLGFSTTFVRTDEHRHGPRPQQAFRHRSQSKNSYWPQSHCVIFGLYQFILTAITLYYLWPLAIDKNVYTSRHLVEMSSRWASKDEEVDTLLQNQYHWHFQLQYPIHVDAGCPQSPSRVN